ncbi:MAG: sodium:proton antiporter [Methylothermaceae bacteria B42]|nr:MAG: sodium:proton antiporter [Methylothermaceae bacteria B42]HHJ39967.1 sodium:proton antiporter [Methylothermaceae bacterium]
MRRLLLTLLVFMLPFTLAAKEAHVHSPGNLINTPIAWICLGLFVLAYVLVMLEEVISMEKSKPLLFCAAMIWVLISVLSQQYSIPETQVNAFLRAELVEYAELFLFLLVATAYVNVLDERNTFKVLCGWLAQRGMSYRMLFWVLGILTFLLSTVVNNLTTVLVVSSVVLMIGRQSPRFITLTCLIAVIASNAGGAFSPFGDITTLMVWQDDKVNFFQFFPLMLPALVNFLIPAICAHWAIPVGSPQIPDESAGVTLKKGTWIICGLFLFTIVIAVIFEQIFHLPPYLGMMAGLACLLLYAYHLDRFKPEESFDIFHQMRDVEWDTLLFFFGVVFAVGGLRFLGFLSLASQEIYEGLGPATANVIVGLLSAVVDNIPVMLAVLHMEPKMDLFQWQLVTLTAGVGGSLLAVGSAAGVAMLGQAREYYTSLSHLRWFPVILLAYAASIAVHYWLNAP